MTIVDDQSIEHKRAERYYWLVELNESMQMVTWIFRYKMAEYFGDADAMEKIKSAPNTAKAQEAMKDIKGFDEKSWNEVRDSVALRKYSEDEEEWKLLRQIASNKSLTTIFNHRKYKHVFDEFEKGEKTLKVGEK